MMAEGSSKFSSVDQDSLYEEQLAHVEELLVSSREECIEMGSKYHDLSIQVEGLINLQGVSSPDNSIESDHFEDEKEVKNDFEEHIGKYETRIAAYQHNQEHQARIVDDLQSRVEEYRIRCAKLEAALAEHSSHEAVITETDSQSQNTLSMDLETALIRLEQETNRGQGLTQINHLLREQLETATEVNQTLTSDVQRLMKEWQQARAQLLAKESEWKEEEQSFSLYFTKESNVLLQMWRQVLNFRHDFANLKSHTERQLSSFNVCICHTIQNVTDVQVAIANRPQSVFISDAVDYSKDDRFSKNQNEFEIPRLQERISELLDRNEKIQELLNEKERANSALCSTVEKINESFNQSVSKIQSSVRDNELENLNSHFSKTIEDLSQILLDDGSVETSSIFSIIQFPDFSNIEGTRNISSSNVLQLQSLVNAVKMALHKYHKQEKERNSELSTLEEQKVMQKRTIEFLEDERERMQKLNSKLSLQFKEVNQKMQDYLNDMKTDSNVSNKQTTALETVVKSLKDQVENLCSERDLLLVVQSDLRSKLQESNEEKRVLKDTGQTLTSEMNRSTKKIAELEIKLETLKKDYQVSQEELHQVSLDKELLEHEKLEFCSVLSNLQNQCLDQQHCLKKLRDEEGFVKDSLATLQILSESLALEKSDLSNSLDQALLELEASRSAQTNAKGECEKEKMELKLQIDRLQERSVKLEAERDTLQSQMQSIEASKRDQDDERSQITILNNDLTNQVTKYSSQKRNIEVELEQVREELKHHKELLEEANHEKNALARSNGELSIRLESIEGDGSQLNDVIAALKEEKCHLEKALYESQQTVEQLHGKKTDIERNLELHLVTEKTLQAQIIGLQDLHKKFVDDAAREKDSLYLKMQEIEHEFQISLKNERHQHNIDVDIITQEKEALRGRMVTAIDELFDRHQKQQDDLLNQHQEEISELKKQISQHESEYDEKIQLLKEERKKIQDDYKQQMSSLKNDITNLKTELSESEELIESLKRKIASGERDHHTLVEKNSEVLKKLKDEMNNMSVEHSNEINNLENKIKDLKQENASMLNEIHQLESQLNEIDSDKSKIAKELDEKNLYYESEKSSKNLLEDRISLIQNQLSDVQSLNEVTSKSLEGCKGRLKAAQRETAELKRQMEEAQQMLSEMEASSSKLQSQNTELKNTLREVEKSRQETKCEAHGLKRSISSFEKMLNSKKEEINELNLLHGREEEIQEALKKEIVQLKQKIMESNATNEAISKEMTNSKQNLSDLEHKLRMQQEQHQSLLRECLSSEQNLSEHRLNLEKSVSDASREIHILRTNLNFEEGKVLALETKVVKLDGGKREVESKLFSVCLFLRSILGLGSDSGFLSISSNPHATPGPSRGSSSEKLAAGSPHRLNLSKSSSTPVHVNISDLDVELLKSSLMDLIQKFNAAEKERDELKDIASKTQRDSEELKAEHSRCISKIYQLKRDLEDKKNVEKELATKIASVHHFEEVIRTLEREKRRLTERIGSAEFFCSSTSKEKEDLIEKLADLKRSEIKLQEEVTSLTSAKETSESRAAKCIKAYQSLEADLAHLRETITSKDQEMMTLEQKADIANKKLKSAESQAKLLESTIDELNHAIEKHSESEHLLKQKVSKLTISLSQTSSSQHNLYEEIEKRQKEGIKYQTDLIKVQQSNEQLRSSADELKLKNKSLRDEVEELKRNLMQSETSTQEQLRRLQSLQLTNQNLEKEAAEQIEQILEQKMTVEEKVRNLSASLRSTKEVLEEKDENFKKLEKEFANMKKSLDRVEKERSRISERTAKSMMEKSSLGTSMRQMELENQTLQQKVQNLQAQLAEMEERHSQRVKDFLKTRSVKSKSEEICLRTALKQAEQLLEAKDKTHRQTVLGLEVKISVLKDHLEQEQKRWQQYHQRSLSASENINYLHSVLSKSLQNVSEDPQRLLPEAERLDITTETELSASHGLSITTPSKLRRSGSYRQMTSTPKAKKRLHLSSQT